MESISFVQCKERGHDYIEMYVFYKGKFVTSYGEEYINIKPRISYFVERFNKVKGVFR